MLTGLARHPGKKPQDMVREMLTYIEYTIKKGGSVLLPTYVNPHALGNRLYRPTPYALGTRLYRPTPYSTPESEHF